MKLFNIAAIFVACAALNGCGFPISFEDSVCKDIKWYDKGYEDAMSGKNMEYFSEYQSRCNAESIDADAYMRGRNAAFGL